MKATIIRLLSDDTRTLGRMMLFDGLKFITNFVTLELPDRGNKTKISRIPAGKYRAKAITSPSNGRCFEIQNVPERSDIQIHVLNFPNETEGCIGLGELFSDIDKDGKMDIASSRKALDRLLRICPDGFDLEIV